MAEKPILFSSAMVRAILDGKKTQTRRPLGIQPLEILTPRDSRAKSLAAVTRKWAGCRTWFALTVRGATAEENRGAAFRCKYGEVGDRLWVRETWGTVRMHELGQHVYGGRRIPDRDQVTYRAGKLMGIPPTEGPCTPDRFTQEWRDDFAPDGGKWKPSIHMPRWASRITLEITEVRVERVQQITEADCIAEGLTKRGYWWDVGANWEGDGMADSAPEAYRALWDSLNAKRGYGWDADPWVWVLTFKPVAR